MKTKNKFSKISLTTSAARAAVDRQVAIANANARPVVRLILLNLFFVFITVFFDLFLFVLLSLRTMCSQIHFSLCSLVNFSADALAHFLNGG